MSIRIYLDEKKELFGLKSDEELALKLGTSKDNISKWVQRDKIPDKWTLMLRQLEAEKDLSINKSDNQSYTFDVLNVQASAGAGIDNFEIEVIDTMSLDKSFFRTPPNINKVKMIEVVGDSMIPTLLPGDHVLIDESKMFSIDGIYAIQMQGQIFIKRLQFNLDGTINIISDNPKYNSQFYNPNDNQTPLKIIGMKTLSIQR